MNIIQRYNEDILGNKSKCDFLLTKYDDQIFIGQDNDGYVAIVIKSIHNQGTVIKQKTKMLSVECNIDVVYDLDGKQENGIVHIIRCLTNIPKEKNIFLELIPLFNDAIQRDDQEDAILELVAILSDFFADKVEPTDAELRGFYSEIYTIWSYLNEFNLGNYWHSNEMLKFDFSLNDKYKIEVKSTIKDERRHHFKHDQLMNDLFDILVVSYKFRSDDKGLSLWDLINRVERDVRFDEKRKLIIKKYKKNVSKERLENMRFDETYTLKNRKIFRSENIPKFVETTPEGVANPEYDCILENIDDITNANFVEEVKQIINA